MNQNIQIRNSYFYNSLNELLQNRMPEISERIESAVSDKGYDDVIEYIELSLEEREWQQVTQWRIDAEVGSTPSHQTGQPFGIGGFVFLEEVEGRQTLYFKMQMYNDFDPTLIPQEDIKIDYSKANDKALVEALIGETSLFLDQFYDKFIAGADIFVPAWRRLKAEWEE